MLSDKDKPPFKTRQSAYAIFMPEIQRNFHRNSDRNMRKMRTSDAPHAAFRSLLPAFCALQKALHCTLKGIQLPVFMNL